MENGHKSHNLGAVRDVVRCVAGAVDAFHDAVSTGADGGKRAADQIVHQGDALGCQPERGVGEQDVIVDEGRAVAHFHEEILAHHTSL